MNTSKWPNFLVIGAQKAGTTSLYHYLKQSNSLFLPKKKEFHFFTRYSGDDKAKLEEYLEFFKTCPEDKIAGEVSPSYLVSEKAFENIATLLSEPKLIAILRHPIDRAYSNFIHARREGLDKNTDFEKAIEEELNSENADEARFKNYIGKGFYYKHLKKYYDHFGKDNIHVILAEDLKNNASREVNSCLKFLGARQIDKLETINENKGQIPKHPILRPFLKLYYRSFSRKYKQVIPKSMRTLFKGALQTDFEKLDSDLRIRLTQEYFTEDIKKLEVLIDKDLSNWLK
ncbi:sulfotransferase domain-containing protein [Ekhidna sp.]